MRTFTIDLSRASDEPFFLGFDSSHSATTSATLSEARRGSIQTPRARSAFSVDSKRILGHCPSGCRPET
jgi:hypothetical protein